jgi:hypothetical protein
MFDCVIIATCVATVANDAAAAATATTAAAASQGSDRIHLSFAAELWH